MKRLLLALVAVLGIGIAGSYASGLWEGFPVFGGGSYCVSTVNGNCSQTVPAGPSAMLGTETMPMDRHAPNGNPPATVIVKSTFFGQGIISNNTTVATATIPANTPWYFLNGTQGSAFTITMPAAPNGNDIQRVVCSAATAGTMTVAANTGQTLLGNPNTTCAASVGYAWIYDQSATTWRRFQ